jgi:hypothetical protein
VEFKQTGRAGLLPTPSLWSTLWQQLGPVSYLATCLLAFLLLGKPMFRLPRGLYALLLASIALFWLADPLLMRLHEPAGYLARGAPLFAALTTGVWVARMFAREGRRRRILDTSLIELRASPAVLGLALLVVIGLIAHYRSFVPRGDVATRNFHESALYRAVRRLPAGVMLAAHPRVASDLPLMAGRSVVVSSKLAHPWWTQHWSWCEQRIHDILRAHYTDEPETLLAVTRKYGIDYWVVDRDRFKGSALRRGGMHFQPFVNWARRNLRFASPSVLLQVPESHRRWDDGRTYYIIATPDLERFIEDREQSSARRPGRRGR